jgi:hypothetical protein
MSALTTGPRAARPGLFHRWLSGAAVAALLLAVLIGGLHSHARQDASHPCALCALAHAPATLSAAVSEEPQARPAERVAPQAPEAPRAGSPLPSLGRAPPAA